MLMSAALATSAQAATNERFSLEITYTGAGSLTQTRTTLCSGQRDAMFRWHSTVHWTTIYAPANLQLLPGLNPLGNAEYPSHQLSGTYESGDPPCLNPGAGTLGEVDGADNPNPIAYMPGFAILNGTDVEFRLSATRHPGETDRNRDFANQYEDGGYGLTNWVANKALPDTTAEVGAPVYSLTGIFTVSLGQLRDLTQGRKASLEIDVQQPSLPAFEPKPQCPECTVAATMSGHVKIIATCHERTKTGPGYELLKPDMKRALTRLYKELDRRRACYRFTIGYRSSSTQKDLFDRWHHIADRQGANDRRSAEQVCAALHNAGFAQCPSGGANFRSGRVAKGGPAKPGTSRHELGEAADITVRFPPSGLKDLAKYQAAAHKAGLCGPPKGDDVHVELPYAAKKGKPILCHFPPGPAP